ncbi:Histone H4 [Cryomyces antarcticus]|uniref:Histone H4 n=1 Tax=Cryomyces antarcticus TaxID=329879 RepID=A0ABR0LZW9_9PEZI|nr:Histone H4 [Cryomyces antarcticus]KAK5257336.1 Histone H4 [Cryomyces antarcticus]
MTSRSGRPGLVSSVMNAFGVGSQSKTGTGGKGLGKTQLAKRHRKLLRDSIRGITKPDIRRLARRRGVKRISANIYDGIRVVLGSV